MGKIKKILENELVGGTQTTDVYPVTSTKAVYDENNNRLDNILTELEQSEGIYDVSTNNDGAVFESLSALLSSPNLSTLIPTSVRHGGMSIRFIQGSEQGSDNKYVQYRLLTTSFSTTESDWTKGGGGGDIYDISKNNGGITYIDLTSALGTNGANVPSSIRKGGMSIMFIKAIPATYNVEKTDDLAEVPSEGTLLESAPSVESGIYTASQLSTFATLPESTTAVAVVYYVAVTTNDTTTYTTWSITMATAYAQKYEQYRLMRDSWSTVVTDWQGVDDKPVYKSDNLAKSGSLYSLTEEAVGYSDFEDIKDRLSVAQNNKVIKDGTVTNQNEGFITTPLQVYKGDTVKITAYYYPSCDAIAIDNGDGTYTKVATGSSSSQSSSTATLQWTAAKDCMVVFSGIYWDSQYNVAEIFLLRASKVETKVNNIIYKKRVIGFNSNLTPGLAYKTTVTLGNKFPFGSGGNSYKDFLRGIFEVKEGEKVYFSTLPYIRYNFSGCAVLDKDYIVISLTPASNEIYFEVPAGGKYVVFQALTASGYPTIYVESLENTTEEIDTTDLELLQNSTINCLQYTRAYIFGDIGTKVTESDNWEGITTKCYSCVLGDIFYITDIFYRNLSTSAFAVVSENNVILAKDTKPIGFWHYMTKVVVPEGGAKLLVNNSFGNLCIYKKKATRDIYPEKEPLVAATSLATVGSNYSDRRLRLSWVSDTHGDNNLYKRWIDWTNIHIGMFDAALHTGDFNRMADADNGFVVTALKYRTILPFLPTLGNHDCFGYTVDAANTLNSGSFEWNGNKYIKPFVENDSACVVSNDGCYYYRDFTDKKIRMIVLNDYDKPRWADGTYWITTTDKSEIASAVEWTSGTSYAVGDVVHYKGMYVKCKTAGILDDNAHVWRPDRAVLSKTITDCRYISQAQADFIINAMNVGSGWGIIFVTHQPYEALPASEHCISKWTLRRDLVNTYVGVKFGQNGYMIQDLITAYLNKTTLNKTYECITPNVNPLAGNVVKTNLPDFYPDVTINVDFTNAVGDVICCLNGHQHSDTAYWSQHTGEKKVLCIGAPTGCYLPFDLWSNPWPSGDIAKSGGAKDCFNAISIDTTEKAVYLVRIGADKTDQFETRDYIRISYAHNQ